MELNEMDGMDGWIKMDTNEKCPVCDTEQQVLQTDLTGLTDLTGRMGLKGLTV